MTTSNGGSQNRTVSALRQPYHKTCEAGHIVLRVQNTAAVIFLCKDTKHLQSTFIIKIKKNCMLSYY